MIDGTYDIKAKTPLGKKKGSLVLVTSGDVCDADVSVGKKAKHLRGSIQDSIVSFEGTVKLHKPFGELDYVLTGAVEGDELKGVCTTKKFKFDIIGTRVV